jgi:hypothetical protein
LGRAAVPDFGHPPQDDVGWITALVAVIFVALVLIVARCLWR